jgi:hypothetical protein
MPFLMLSCTSQSGGTNNRAAAQFARSKFGAQGKRTFVVLSPKLLGAIYVAIGIFVAANKHYFQSLDTVKLVLSAVIAILLWPLLLLGVNLHLK